MLVVSTDGAVLVLCFCNLFVLGESSRGGV